MTKFQRLELHTFLLVFVIVGCNTQIATQSETATPAKTFSQTPTNTKNSTVTTTPSLAQTSESAQSMAEMLHADEYILENVITIKEPGRYYYEIRSWDNAKNDYLADNRISISTWSFETIWIDYARLGELPQVDITGEGDPDVIIYGWGARLSNPVYIYNLGYELTKVFDSYRVSCSRPSGCDFDMFEFKDLNNDGVYEIISYDAAFGSFDCGPSMGPMPLIIYAYNSELRHYEIINPLYPEQYNEIIETTTRLAEESPKYKCVVSDHLLNYFYSGQIEKGWSELNRIYQGDDVESFRKEIEDLLEFKREKGRFVLLEDLETK